MGPDATRFALLELLDMRRWIVIESELTGMTLTTICQGAIWEIHTHFQSSHQLQRKLLGSIKVVLHPRSESRYRALMGPNARKLKVPSRADVKMLLQFKRVSIWTSWLILQEARTFTSSRSSWSVLVRLMVPDLFNVPVFSAPRELHPRCGFGPVALETAYFCSKGSLKKRSF